MASMMPDKSMTPTPELLPCPFCGSSAEQYFGAEDSDFKGLFGIQCASANTDNDDEYPEGCDMVPDTGWAKREAEAAEKWNRRVTPPAAIKESLTVQPDVIRLKSENDHLRFLLGRKEPQE